MHRKELLVVMELKFKIQPYQTAAAEAVTRVFEGQPNQGAQAYLRDLGRGRKIRGTEALPGFCEGGEEGYGNAPVQLDSARLLKNIAAIQRGNQLEVSPTLHHAMGACQLDVEMETGTGKTYVYTKTMFELNRQYGWTKFIVVVPSVAIREGVFKSLQTTEQHFFEQYGKSIRYFVYDSDRLNELDAYSQSSDISAMIINMQAFNASMKEGANNKAARIIFDERDDFGSRRPIDVIAANRPIVIVDEPQKMGKVNSATQQGIARFNPLFCLYYSATHRDRHNMVYVLDALDAYNQRLVKRIEVKGFELKNMRGTDGYLYLKDIVVSKNRAPEAVIEFKQMGAGGKVRKVTKRFGEGDSIYEASGSTRLEAYRDYVIASGNDGVVPPQDGRPGYVRFLNGETIYIGEVYRDSAQDDLQRVQIRETIQSHLDKEEALFKRGIKCLSLFFIDEVAKYRDVSGTAGGMGVYGHIFEEEYAALVQERLARRTLDDEMDAAYVRYLQRDDAHQVHSGYFSVDKNGKSVECKAEKKAEREDGLGINDDDAKRGYDLILRDKERLLSLEEPVRFIFSHSALREGWDNPNVFQICTLRSGGTEASRRQEVGRGLRLCVNQDGVRQDLGELGEGEVHKVNVLTVVAGESYSEFVGALQSDIARTLRARPKKVDDKFFVNRPLVVDGAEVKFGENESRAIYKFLLKNDYLDDDDRPSEKFREQAVPGAEVSFISYVVYGMKKGGAEVSEAQAKAVEALLKSVEDPKALEGMIVPPGTKVTENKLNENFARREFQELWARINHKHAYTVEFSDEELRRKAIARIDADLQVSQVEIVVTIGGQRVTASREDLASGESFGVDETRREEILHAAGMNVRYDLVGEVAQGAAITRQSAAHILSGILPGKFEMFKRNPEEFIKKVSQLIVSEKAAMVVEHVTYHRIEGEFDSAIFTTRMPERLSRAHRSRKGVQDYLFPDSEIERKFAEDLDAAEAVCVYAKLPRSFAIPTPVGDYAPDWAIAFERDKVQHVFFVAETKGDLETLELRPVEKAKIACAKKVFEELSALDGRNVKYHAVASYEQLWNTINGTQ